MSVKSIFIVWGSAPALAIATVLILNVLSAGMYEERGEGLAGTGEGERRVGESIGSTGGQGQEQATAKSEEMARITSEPEGERERMLAEPSQLLREAQEHEGEQYIKVVLPYITGVVAASLSFIIVRRFVYRQG
ncbi:MAG: hypothetical protein QXL93_04130 [Candidatus Nitrosocaldus sp.]